MPVSEKNRILYMTTPLGEDVLLLRSFSGIEAMSQLFRFDLRMVSETEAIKAKDIVGKSITWQVQYKEGPPRFFNGFVSRFGASGLSPRGQRGYRAEVVPWLWFLTQTANCRIFQKKTAPEIIQKVFDDLGFTDYELELKNTYAKRDYCVQYRETSFNFVSRLMEEEGIFFFFKHEDGKHTLVLADQKSSYKNLPESVLEVETWERQFEYCPGKYTQTDYNFETPSTSLLTNTSTVVDLPNISKFEVFDYPGIYQVKSDGDATAKRRMEEEEASYEVGSGSSECRDLTPGGKFSLGQHEAESEEGKSYVVTYVEHTASDVDFETGEGKAEYTNTFRCIPDSVTFRPERRTRKPERH
jgi:type VI secretion system secreted protein VgrG